jgi:hypothetical protein
MGHIGFNEQTLQEKGSKPRTSASTNSIEYKESLEASAVVSKLSDTVQTQINNLLANWPRKKKPDYVMKIAHQIAQNKEKLRSVKSLLV